MLHLDFEVFSEAKLEDVGAYRYAEDPSTEILMAAYAWGREKPKLWVPAEGEPMPKDFRDMMRESRKIAWNANFERCIIREKLPEFDPSPKNFYCAMVQSLYLGLPGKLDMAGQAMGAHPDKAKMKEGKALIRKFCMPCKPTKKHPSTRWLPKDAPAEWETFKRYCLQDVVAEQAIWYVLQSLGAVPPEEWETWIIDQEINDRGILVDHDLVAKAIRLGARAKADLRAEIQSITGVANPNAPAQIRGWLLNRGLALPDMQAETIEAALNRPDLIESDAYRVLELRAEASRSSLSKYETMAVAASLRDGRVRGIHQFYGANRTGRWGGRLVQTQNMFRGIFEGLDLLNFARDMLRDEDYDAMVSWFGSGMGTLATLTRTVIVAPEGKLLTSVDLSAIEARVLAWAAKEEWRLEVFRTHGKIYEASASTSFKVPLEEFARHKTETGRHHPLRKKGKVTELACFGPDTLILTNRGAVAIKDTRLSDKVWDGTSWVSHEGLVEKGPQEVIDLCGVAITPNHLILVGESWTEARTVASSENILLQGLATGSENLPFLDLKRESRGPASLRWFASSVLAALRPIWFFLRTFIRGAAPGAIHAPKSNPGVGSKSSSGTPTSSPMTTREGAYSTEFQPASHAATAPRAASLALTGDVESRCFLIGARINGLFSGTSRSLRDLTTRLWSWTGLTSIKGMNQGIYGLSPRQRTVGTKGLLGSFKSGSPLSKPRTQSYVYDLLNCGPRNRFTILTNSGPLIVHNCGYQGSVGALIRMGALKEGLQEDELLPMVRAWRAGSPNIVAFWWNMERAAKNAIRNRGVKYDCWPVSYTCTRTHLIMELPSKRRLFYANPDIAIPEGGDREQIGYWGVDQKTKQWGKQTTYGGKLTENAIQAISRDILREIIRRLWRKNVDMTMLVHDEVVAEILEGEMHILLEAMTKPIGWAEGLPLAAAGYENDFYMKD